ncbi:hypothetical protein NFI96_025097 [Prochilodus magdalenae]|nr:hypothetical protein NFI96_025097 [Prochilodus magdalenae]
MVKLGINVSEKKSAGAEEGFDTIPLMTPLDAAQLQPPPPETVLVKTKADYSEDRNKEKFRPKITVVDGASERIKMALLVVCALAFLVCVVFLVVFKVYQYEQPCPDGFTYMLSECRISHLAGSLVVRHLRFYSSSTYRDLIHPSISTSSIKLPYLFLDMEFIRASQAATGILFHSSMTTVLVDVGDLALLHLPFEDAPQQSRCVPAGVYSYYPPQGPASRGRLFTIINHYNVAKQTITRAVSPWLSITAEEKISQLQTKTEQSLA